ncbi:MAG TPA: ribosome maturation factor RimP [Sphingomonadaceae bacterium]|nr:ribosome maturation factor RimP [Sphingomonadaceae bacterium]
MADRIQALLEPTITGLGYELLGIERGRSGEAQLLRLYIDHPDGIALEDCERVSRQVSDVLEVEQAIRGEFTLEVSSPGLDRPLFTLEQHRRYLGELIRLRLRNLVQGRRRVSGRLTEVTTDGVVLDIDGEPFAVALADIERSRLVADFEQASGTPAGPGPQPGNQDS